MGLYVGNTKYKVMSGNNKASLFQVYPYDSEVEYLRNSGLAYIVIQTASLPTYKKEICFEKTSGFTTSSYTSVTGCFDTTTLNLWFNNAACVFNYKGKENTFSINVPVNTRCVATINGNALSLEFGGSTYSYTGSAGTNTSSTNVRLFSGNSGRPGVYSIYHYKMWNDNDELILDLIPVRVGTTGYMYDRVSGKLFGNSGTGSFVLGPDKPIYDAEVEYLESTGTQYIDTGIVVTSTDNMFIDFQKTTSYSYQAFYAGRRTNENNATSYSLGQINGKFDGRLGSGNLGYGTSINLNRHTLELDPVNGNVIQDSSTTASCGSFASSNLPVYLFGVNTNGAVGYSQHPIRVFEFSISDKIHLIPVRVGPVGYMYDTISHKLFGNAGTGSFIVGNDKN